MKQRTAVVRNEAGIHCRPSVVIMKAVAEYPGRVTASADGVVCDFSSVLSLMALGLLPGSQVSIEVEGPDEEAVCQRLTELFETRFDFPPDP